MTTDNQHISNTRKRRCLIAAGSVFLLLLLLFIVVLILALSVFKLRDPKTQFVSATVDGIAPRISFPVINIELNITLNLKLLVENPNRASFNHGPGKSFVLYRGNQVGEADLEPGLTPAKGSESLACRLTLQVDNMTSNVTALLGDVLAGQLVMETSTRTPGRVTFWGIFKKHAVAIFDCQLTIAVPAMEIQSRECKSKTKL